ncbi:MAG: AtpZ/AtpI family protein [Beijerinckiaceae bacterium]|nr:AtpZ/AtpI family protein [Beijerinckiaceae bacterium]
MAGRGNGQGGDQPGAGEPLGKTPRQREGGERESHNLQARLDRLKEALDAQPRGGGESTTAGPGQRGGPSGAMGKALSLAFRVLSEFVAAVIVGTLIGWGIDHMAGTSPAFIIVFVLMGAAAGFWNVYRIGTEKPGAGGG